MMLTAHFLDTNKSTYGWKAESQPPYGHVYKCGKLITWLALFHYHDYCLGKVG